MTRRSLILALSAAASKAVAANGPLRVLLVTGGHDHPPSFYSIFEGNGFRVTVDPHPRAFAYDMRKRFDVLVLYDMIKDGLEEKKRANLQAFAESGKGIVVVHHALCSHGDWPWWYEELTGARWIEPGTAGHEASVYKEDLDLEMTPIDVTHPVVAGLKPFKIYDETYGKLWFSKDIQVLMKTSHPTSDGPVVWVGPWKKSRVITLQPGHGSEAHHHQSYRTLLQNAILWAGRRK
jgi:type 1 glutamine amidotransferase